MTMTTRGYGSYGKSSQGVGAYQSAAAQPRAMQIVRLMDELLSHISNAHERDQDRRIAEEFSSVQSATFILKGLSGMLDMRQGHLAESLDASYRSLIVALNGVCALIDSQNQYVRLYMSVLELRNAWATVLGLSKASAPEALLEIAKQGVVTGKGTIKTF